MPDNKLEIATLGGGCFWCVEAVYERVEGVKDVISGYAGGHTKNPTYNAIYGYVLVNALNDKNGLQPQYMEMQFINRSGSTWSYKIDANKIVTGVPK